MDFRRELVPEPPQCILEASLPVKWGYPTIGDMVAMAMRLPHELRQKQTGFQVNHQYRRLNIGLHRYMVATERVGDGLPAELQELRFGDRRLPRRCAVEVNLSPSGWEALAPEPMLVVRYRNLGEAALNIVRFSNEDVPRAAQYIYDLLERFDD